MLREDPEDGRLPAEVAPPRDRVRAHTAPAVLARIDAAAARRLRALEGTGARAALRRLAELDREWDVDRALMANLAIVGGLGLAAGARALRRRRGAWTSALAFVSAQLGFLLLHAIRGWCPPLPVLRRLGFRTQQEIAHERAAVVRRVAELERARAAGAPYVQ